MDAGKDRAGSRHSRLSGMPRTAPSSFTLWAGESLSTPICDERVQIPSCARTFLPGCPVLSAFRSVTAGFCRMEVTPNPKAKPQQPLNL